MVVTILAAIFVFGLLVLVHEAGHFLTAKMTGMRVDEFAIGFGPKVLEFQHGETVYCIRALPLGGFNNIAGMDPDDKEAGDRAFNAKPVGSRLIVMLAGSVMNFVLPIFLFFGVFFFSGVSTPVNEPVLGDVIAGKPADQAGLIKGDRIISIDGKELSTWGDLVQTVSSAQGTQTVVYERDGNTFETEMTPHYDKSAGRAMVGVMSSVNKEYPGLVNSASMAVERTGIILYKMCEALLGIITGSASAELAGPLGVAQMAGEAANIGIVSLINFTALLSLNLGIINLFPVPALDGGHCVTLVLEAVRGKPLSSKALYYTQCVGIALIVLLMIYATKSDIVRIFFG